MAIHNIERCLKVSTDKAEQIAKKSWTRFGPMIMEVLRFKVICKNINKYVTIKGRRKYKKKLCLMEMVVSLPQHIVEIGRL